MAGALVSIIYTDDAMYLTKHRHRDWCKAQDAFTDDKASLHGFDQDALIEFLEFAYPAKSGKWPNRNEQVAAFVREDAPCNARLNAVSQHPPLVSVPWSSRLAQVLSWRRPTLWKRFLWPWLPPVRRLAMTPTPWRYLCRPRW